MSITIGMATTNDYTGTVHTIQGLRCHLDPQPDQYVVVDNCPKSDHGKQLAKFMASVNNGVYVPFDQYQATTVKGQVFTNATSDWVICIDSHVQVTSTFWPSARKYIADNPHSRNLIQGPIVLNNMTTKHTHMEPKWRGNMLGTWAMDERGRDPAAPPFEIPQQGMGMFMCRREAWPGFNPLCRGFGGEEGYIHDKFRLRGDTTVCVPGMVWWHQFDFIEKRGPGANIEDIIRNYLRGYIEFDKPLDDLFLNFRKFNKSERQLKSMAEQVLLESKKARIVTKDAVLRLQGTPISSYEVC